MKFMEVKGTLAIVTGANGAVGAAYLKRLSERPGVRSVGITRTPVENRIEGVDYRQGVDLLDQNAVEEVMGAVRLEEALRVVLIHPVGRFKFEEVPPKEPDPSILRSNGGTLQYAVSALFKRRRPDTSLVVCGFGSVSDRYNVRYWTSYTAAKNEVRATLRGLADISNPAGFRTLSLMVNVSTTDTGNESTLRPNADRSHWLQPSTIVDQTLPILLAGEVEAPFYREMDVFVEKPGFDPLAYYGNPEAVLSKWRRERGDI